MYALILTMPHNLVLKCKNMIIGQKVPSRVEGAPCRSGEPLAAPLQQAPMRADCYSKMRNLLLQRTVPLLPRRCWRGAGATAAAAQTVPWL